MDDLKGHVILANERNRQKEPRGPLVLQFLSQASFQDRFDGSEVRSAAIVTTEPNELMRSIHNRMPVILPAPAQAAWLDPAPRSGLQGLLIPYPAAEMEAYPVSTLVNSPANDRAEILERNP